METESRIFPDFLIFCRWAESSYLALKKFKKDIPLKDKDKKAIKDAITFLDSAKYGRGVIENLKLGQNALTASYAFKEAFSATLSTFRDKEVDKNKVDSILDNFISILKQIDEEGAKSKAGIDELISFFSYVRESTLESSAGTFDRFVNWSNVNVSNSS